MAAKTQTHEREEDYPPPDVRCVYAAAASLSFFLHIFIWTFSFDKSLLDEEFIWHRSLPNASNNDDDDCNGYDSNRNFRFDFRPMSALLLPLLVQ